MHTLLSVFMDNDKYKHKGKEKDKEKTNTNTRKRYVNTYSTAHTCTVCRVEKSKNGMKSYPNCFLDVLWYVVNRGVMKC